VHTALVLDPPFEAELRARLPGFWCPDNHLRPSSGHVFPGFRARSAAKDGNLLQNTTGMEPMVFTKHGRRNMPWRRLQACSRRQDGLLKEGLAAWICAAGACRQDQCGRGL